MNKRRENIWLLIAVLFAFCIALVTLTSVVTNPSVVLLELGGDGIKNYYTYLYHSLYGNGFWFDGMNYPVGEHIVYADGQSFLSVPLGFLRRFITVDIALITGIMNWAMTAGFILAIVYNYKLLVYFKVPRVMAMAFAALIVLISPQLLRIFGHYGLSYLCIIPMIFYWSVKYHGTNHLRYPLYIFLTGSIMAFAHPYFAGMVLVWVAFYACGYLLLVRQPFKTKLRHLLPMIISVVCVLVVVKSVMTLTDPITDRPAYPYGTLSACTTGLDIFTSSYSTFWNRLKREHIVTPAEAGEGLVYIGLVPLLVIFISVIIVLVKKSKRNTGTTSVFELSGFSPIWLFIAFASLLLGMGVPFVWHVEWLLDYLSVLRQFRSLGRFSLMFYYIITIFSIVLLFHWYVLLLEKNKKAVAYMLVFSCIVVWAYESKGFVKHSREKVSWGIYNFRAFHAWDEPKDWKDFLNEHNYKANDFQACMLLPYLHVGTEKIWIHGENSWLFSMAAKACIQLKIPIVNVLMSRSSWSQAFSQVKTVAGPFADKPWLKSFRQDMPLLLLFAQDKHPDPDTKYLMDASQYLGNYSQCNVYAFYPARIIKNDRKYGDSAMAVSAQMTSTDTCIGCSGDYYINHFETGNAPENLFGKGAEKAIDTKEKIILNIPFKPAGDTVQYEFSVWTLVNGTDYSSPDFLLEFYDSSGIGLGYQKLTAKESVDNKGMWLRASVYFKVPSNCRKITCKLYNDPMPAYFALDEMQIRPAHAITVSKIGEGNVLVNNHLYINK